MNDNLLLTNNNVNLIITTDIIIAVVLFVPMLFIFSYFYYKINNIQNYKKKKKQNYDWVPLIFPYAINFIIWIILLLVQEKNTSSIWIFYNLFFLTFNLIISTFFSWWYMLINLPIYLIIIYFARFIVNNSFQNDTFFYSFLIIAILICLFSWFISFFNNLKKYVIFTLFSLLFIIMLILDFKWMYSEEKGELIKYITCSAIVICYLLAISSYYLNNKFFAQSNAFFTLSRNIQYDYLYFYNKAYAITEINQLINENKINLMYINIFNFEIKNKDKFTNIEIETYLTKILKEIIYRLNGIDYIAFITYDNNFGIAIYKDVRNKNSNDTKLSQIQMTIEDALNGVQKIYEFNNKTIIFELLKTHKIYGINGRIISKLLTECDEIIYLKKNSKDRNIYLQKNYYSFIENNSHVQNIVGDFLNKNNNIIYLIRSKINTNNNFFIECSSIKPLITTQNFMDTLIKNNKYNNFLLRYLAYVGFLKFNNVIKKEERLFIIYPFSNLLENPHTWLNLFQLLEDFKINKQHIVLSFDFYETKEISLNKLSEAIKIIKNYEMLIAVKFPYNLNEFNWLVEHISFLDYFDFVVVDTVTIGGLWPKSYTKKINELLNYSNTNEKIIYY